MKKDKYEEVITYIVENQEKFYRLAYTYVRDKEDALDIVQNAICKALENYESLRNTKAIRTWFYRILVNESITYIRRYGKEVQVEDVTLLVEQTQEVVNGAGETEVEQMVSKEELYQRIFQLPLDLQNIIKLRYFEEMSLQEVADVLEMNLNSVKAKLYRGLKKLKIQMEESEIWEK